MATSAGTRPFVGIRREPPPKLSDEHVGFNGRLAAWVTKFVGSMWVVYFVVAFTLVWMALATWGPLHPVDPYPFPFLLFMGNVVQLMLVFIILVGQGVLGAAAERRALQTYVDAEAILHEMERLHDHMVKQDQILNRGIKLVDTSPHPWIAQRRMVKPTRVAAHHVGINGRIGAFLTSKVSSMWAFYLSAVLQFGWIGLATWGFLRSVDPYPFPFLLFISSLLQLIFMFVIMVGQGVLGQAGDNRAHQTYLDAEAILHECGRLQHHLTAQDKALAKICGYISDHAPETFPVRLPEATLSTPPSGGGDEP